MRRDCFNLHRHVCIDHGSVALPVDIEPVWVAGRLSVDEHAKRHPRARLARPQNQMGVASVEPGRRPSEGNGVAPGMSASGEPAHAAPMFEPLIALRPPGQAA
jgi:hypothetical protein